MRLRLLIEVQEAMTIPWDYRTALTRIVYEILRAVDPGYSTWLHEQGFRCDKRIYRLFVYSDLMPMHWNFSRDGLADVRWMTWHIGSPDQRFIDKLVLGLERNGQQLKLFGVFLQIVDMVCIEAPDLGSGLTYQTISPVAASIRKPDSKHPTYLRPDQPEFVEALQRNLITKWQSFYGREWSGGEFGLRVWNPKQKLVRVFNTAVRAWYLKLQMWGEEELIRFAYDAGLGIKNSQGFGMIEPEV